MPPSVGAVAERIERLLPQDGTPVLNRVLQVMLSRELESPISPDLYFQASDHLSKEQRIGRLRGQGGQIFLLPKAGKEQVNGATVELRREAMLMAPLGRYLTETFCKGLDLPPDGVSIVQDTSTIGPVRGRFARPDFILVTAMRFRLLPGAQIDVHSFELKAENGATDESVYEALAQTRFTHFGHLVWHLPQNSRCEARLPEIEKQCDQHGIGLIRMRDPHDHVSYEILLDPVRKTTPPAIVDGLLESRLSAAHRERLLRVVNGGPGEG
ncbi:hypothetical protein [Pseudorhodoplanes sinuspersici]|uniref:Uncharacterized protein n=1 Tax=Pseudorhodoplanes sinuspersici TaxID=1235591 RepID=A0A1W6ZLU4_9HYPH|nr:hypothetical protein [Pseudorhodoplanes sinuspersici]ARP98329.1 hypothetical protein CAK95_03920 [Pseudorhodoplanes sinuspersici]RKE65986.1 hypothetical protein DFP91_5560 [Pseudorhodoplanes sinuspersici]